MAKKSPSDKLAESIEKILAEYADEVSRGTVECVKEVTKAGVKAVKAEAKEKFGGTGKYSKGWKSTVEETRLGATGIIYNGSVPGLAHLLEHGHVSRNGTGRVFGNVPGREHLAPIDEQIAKDFEDAINKVLT